MRSFAAVSRAALALALACSIGAASATVAGAAPMRGAAPASGAAPKPRAAPAAALTLAPQVQQPLAILDHPQRVFARPGGRSPRSTVVAAVRPITGARTVLPVLGERTGRDGRRWLHVLLPGRPNGHSGWISARGVRNATSPWRLLVDISARHVTAVYDGQPRRTFRVIVGAPSTPTPRGDFFVEETLRLSSFLVGAPFALALSARSDVLDQFAGGPGQIALHGLGGVGGRLGTAVSHGCIRLDERSISWLAARIRPGTPVTIAR